MPNKKATMQADNKRPEALVEESALETPPLAEEGDHHYDSPFMVRVIEGALLAFGDTLSVDRLFTLFDEGKRPSKQQILEALQSIAENQHDRGFILKEVASGWRFEVCDDLAPWINRLWEEKPQKYSRALLETLALIAYRQPLTRGDIEDVRGVAVSSHIIKTLTEREWVKVVGNRDVPGRPALYATTRQFLDYFGLKSLEELPSLGELQDIETLSKALDLEAESTEAAAVKATDTEASITKIEGNEVASNEVENTELDGAELNSTDVKKTPVEAADVANVASNDESGEEDDEPLDNEVNQERIETPGDAALVTETAVAVNVEGQFDLSEGGDVETTLITEPKG